MKSTEQIKPRWVPVALLVLSLLTSSMLAVAVGVMLDILPAWAPSLETVDTGSWSGMNRVLPIVEWRAHFRVQPTLGGLFSWPLTIGLLAAWH